MKIIGHRLREIREKLGIDQIIMAEKIGVSRNTLSSWERGISFPGADKIFLLHKTFNIDIRWLIAGQSGEKYEDGEYVRIPLIEGRVTAGPDGGIITENKGEFYPFKLAWVESRFGSGRDRIAALVLARVRGDSMCPTINNNEMVLVDTWESDRVRIANGHIYFVRLADGQTTAVKRLTISEINNKISLVCLSDNPAYKPFSLDVARGERLQQYVLGRVRWVGREID